MAIKQTKSSCKVMGGGKVIAAGTRKQPKTNKTVKIKMPKMKHDPNVVG
jgi:hypothetical protein